MPAKIDLTNKQFGEWTVLREATAEEKNYRPGAYWYCKCSCGTEKIVNGQTLRNGESKSCGCKTIDYIIEKNNKKAKDLTGQKFGRLTVLYRDFDIEKEHPHRGSTYWKCRCDCGNIVSVTKNSLEHGTTKSCGCLRKEVAAAAMQKMSSQNYKDEIGNRYGKLVVIGKSPICKRHGAYWICQCDCGNIIHVLGNSLRRGNTTSCGCNTQSHGEQKIEHILKENNINFQEEYTVNIDNKKLRFDFCVFNNLNKDNILYMIEFDGKQHYQPVELFGGEKYYQYIKSHDQLKNNWCMQHHIPLIRIPYTKLENLCIQDLQLHSSQYLITSPDQSKGD